jgi:homoserine dehydrogenase
MRVEMSALASEVGVHAPEPAAAPAARIALLGTGQVGSALLRRLAERPCEACAGLSLLYVANSRHARLRAGNREHQVATALDDVAPALGADGTRIVIDATASDEVATRHARWLARGIHVVTACKLAQGTSLQRWRELQAARVQGGTGYGDAATVGAGLPLLRSIRDLRAGGDRIHAIAGVLSGSLAWLFNHYDGLRPFSGFVRRARDAGYTEPDPREDLSGEDVRRKILILARAAGYALESDAVEVESLVPAALAELPREAVDAALPMLDAALRERFARARKEAAKLRFVARLEHGRARVGLEALAEDHPLAGGAGTDNRVAIWSDRYREQPLVIQGPGAGAEVTAAGLLDDVLRIAGTAS